MSENMIAICLYIGILLMAGTVLVLTIIYFVRPPSTKTNVNTTSDVKQDANDGKQNIKKKPFNFQIKKFKSSKAVTPNIETIKPDIKDEPVMPNVEPAKPENKDEPVVPNIEPVKPENTNNEVMPTVEINKTDNKEVNSVKQVVEVRPVDNEKIPEIVLAVKPEKELNTNIVPQSIGSKSENQEQLVPKETLKAEAVVSPQSSPMPDSDIIKPKPDSDSHSSNINDKPANVEAAKKESETKMEIKNVKEPTKSAVEKNQTTPVTVKPAAPATNAIVGKKGPEQKTSLDDLSKMFSKEVVDDNEATKLAQDMKDVEINNLVKDGQDLINLLKRNRS